MRTYAPLNPRVFWSVVVAGLALAVSGGCTQVMVSPQTRGEYKLGDLQVYVDRDFATTYAAAKAGMKDAGLFEVRDDRLAIEAELNGRDSTDTRVFVKIKEVGKNRTSVKIRYGYTGTNLASAQKLFTAIEKRL